MAASSARKAGEPVVKPSRERRRHGRVQRAEKQVQDAEGGIGLPWRAEGLLGQLERRGDIDAKLRLAGERFQSLFAAAALDPLKAADMARVSSASTVNQHGAEAARRKIGEALDALGGIGSPCGSCAWFILGCDLSMREWAMREGWSGRPISQHVVKGLLIGSLGVLAQHFGY